MRCGERTDPGRRAAEHTARLQAEADARHATQRLAVAQQQIAEYAAGRAADARALADDSGKLDKLLAQVRARCSSELRAVTLVVTLTRQAPCAGAAAREVRPAGGSRGEPESCRRGCRQHLLIA